MLVGVYHLCYILRTKPGRQLVKDFWPVKKDLADVFGAVRYLCGLSKHKPKFGRFGYAEKMEYWAVIWGTIIMGATGLIVWFKMDVTQWLPRWAVDVALTIHYYEAILACLAIVVWHFYHVIFDPEVYPINWAWWDGKVDAHWYAEEHPLDPIAGNDYSTPELGATRLNQPSVAGDTIKQSLPQASKRAAGADEVVLANSSAGSRKFYLRSARWS